MKNRQLLAALLATVLTVPAFAGDGPEFPEADRPSTLTRAEVRAGINQARATDTLGGAREDRLFAAELSRADQATRTGQVTREQVRAELQRARADGSMVSFDEAPLRFLVPTGPTRSREDVRAEARQAARDAFSSRRGS